MNSPDNRFSLGRVVATPSALAVLTEADIARALFRHSSCDWGELNEHDQKENEFSLHHGLRLLSVYRSGAGIRFYIITEADRTVTTILLPEDY